MIAHVDVEDYTRQLHLAMERFGVLSYIMYTTQQFYYYFYQVSVHVILYPCVVLLLSAVNVLCV